MALTERTARILDNYAGVVDFIARMPSLDLQRTHRWQCPDWMEPYFTVLFWQTLGDYEDEYKVEVNEYGISLYDRGDDDGWNLQAEFGTWEDLGTIFQWDDHLRGVN